MCTGRSPPAPAPNSRPAIPTVPRTSPSAQSRSWDAPGEPVIFTAITNAIVMLLGGEPIGERFIDWNFVSSSRARIEQAKADWRSGRMKLPVHDDAEFIPLPPDRG